MEDVPDSNCLAKNSPGDLPATELVTLGLKSIISEAYIPPTVGKLFLYKLESYEFTVTKSPGSAASIT